MSKKLLHREVRPSGKLFKIQIKNHNKSKANP